MKPVKFEQSNVVFAADQKPYLPLPAHRGDNGQVISCWGLSLRERVIVLVTGRVWHSTLTFGQPLQPLKLMAEFPFEKQGWLRRVGLIQGAIAPIVDKLDAVPEAQRGWYVPGADANAGKFILDHSKVEFEDTGALKSALQKERDAIKAEKAARKAERDELLKTYEGIDPVKTRALLAKFDGEDEAALIAAGKIDEVINRRMEKHTKAQQKLIDEAAAREDGAMELAQSLMADAVDNKVRAACAKAGLHASAIEDALLRASAIFTLDDDANVVQFDENDEVVLGKDGKTPFSPAEWLEGMKEAAPHWFPAGGSGGGAGGPGKGGNGGGKTMTRAAFEALDPFAKAATIKEKVAIVD
jgi:hypothetical protein